MGRVFKLLYVTIGTVTKLFLLFQATRAECDVKIYLPRLPETPVNMQHFLAHVAFPTVGEFGNLVFCDFSHSSGRSMILSQKVQILRLGRGDTEKAYGEEKYPSRSVGVWIFADALMAWINGSEENRLFFQFRTSYRDLAGVSQAIRVSIEFDPAAVILRDQMLSDHEKKFSFLSFWEKDSIRGIYFENTSDALDRIPKSSGFEGWVTLVSKSDFRERNKVYGEI